METPLVATLQTIQAVDILDDKTVQVTVDTPNTELIYSFVTAIIPAGAEKMQRRIRLEQDRFLLFLTLRRRESFLQRMRITGRKDFLILMR